MHVTTQETQGCTVVMVDGRLDAETAPQLESACMIWIEDGKRRFVLDLGAVSYISSAGLRAILAIAKRLKQVGSSLAVCRLIPIVREVFAISGFDRLFPVADSVEAAITQL
jgi:stage II sporulation protein AA (anti-sigma F factor antagonist)